MHPYSTDSGERRIVHLLLAGAAIAAAFLLDRYVYEPLSVPWWVDAPSTLGLFGLLYYLFDHHLWRRGFVRKLGLVRVPDVSGIWEGDLTSSHAEFSDRIDARAVIEQRWTRLIVRLETGTSRSYSTTAALNVNAAEGIVLTYQYRNEPVAAAPATMHAHSGTTWLLLEEGRLLEGYYYSGRGRQQHGEIRLRRDAAAE